MRDLKELRKSFDQLAPIDTDPPKGEASLTPRVDGPDPSSAPKKDALKLVRAMDFVSPRTQKDPYGLSGLDGALKSAEDRVGNMLAPGTNPYEIAAREQSAADQLFNGLFVKAPINFATVFLGGTAGVGPAVAQGMSNLVADEEGKSFIDGLINNGFANSMDIVNDEMRRLFPNLQTKMEQDMGNLQYMKTMNFWADDFANGISFTLGAVATEAAWSAATAATWGAAAPGQAAATATLFARTAKFFKNLKKLGYADKVSALKAGAQTVSGARFARQIFTGAAYEAAFESRHAYNEMVKAELDLLKEKDPQGMYGEADIDPETMDRIRSTSNYLWGGNLALISASNFLVFGRTFKMPGLIKASRAARANATILETAGEGAAATTSRIIKPKSLFEKIGLTTMHLTKGTLSEGFMEEGGQNLMNRMAINHVNKSHDPMYAASTYELLGSFTEALGQAHQDKNFYKEIIIGSIIGSLGSSYMSPKAFFKENMYTRIRDVWKDARPDLLPFLDMVNNSSLDSALRANITNLSTNGFINTELTDAIERGDISAGKDAEDESIFAYIYSRKQMGLDSAIEGDLQRIQAMSPQEYAENFLNSREKGFEMTDDQIIAEQKKSLTRMREAVTQFSVAIDNAEIIFAGQPEAVIRGASYLMFDQQRVEQRIEQVNERLASKLPELSAELETIGDSFLDSEISKKTLTLSKELEAAEEEVEKAQKKVDAILKRGQTPGKTQANLEAAQARKDELEAKKSEKEAELRKAISGEDKVLKKLSEITGKTYSENTQLDELLDSFRNMVKIRKKLEKKSDIPISEREELAHMLNDITYLKRKKHAMDLFMNGIFGSNIDQDTNFFSAVKSNSPFKSQSTAGLQLKRKEFADAIKENGKEVEKYLKDAIDDLLEKVEDANDITRESATEQDTPLEYNYRFLAELGTILGSVRAKDALKKEEERKKAEKKEEDKTKQEAGLPVEETPTETEDEEEEEVDDWEEDPKTPFDGKETWARIHSIHDRLFDMDEFGNQLGFKKEFLDDAGQPDMSKMDAETKRAYIFYAGLYSLHALKNKEEDHMLTYENGDQVKDPKDLVFRTYSQPTEEVGKELFEIEGKTPIVVRLETKKGRPVKINNEDMISWLPEASFVNTNENTGQSYLKFSFKEFFRGLSKVSFDKQKLGDLETLDERVRAAEKDDNILYPLKVELLAYEKEREAILEGEQREYPVSSISFNPGKIRHASDRNARTEVLSLFGGSIEKFKKGIKDGRVYLSIVGGRNKKGKPQRSNIDKSLGSVGTAPSGTVYIIIDKVPYKLENQPMGEEGLEAIEKLFDSLGTYFAKTEPIVKRLWSKNKKVKADAKKELEKIAERPSPDDSSNPNKGPKNMPILKFLRDITSVKFIPVKAFKVSPNKEGVKQMQIAPYKLKEIKKNTKKYGGIYVSVAKHNKKDDSVTKFVSFLSYWKIYYYNKKTEQLDVIPITELFKTEEKDNGEVTYDIDKEKIVELFGDKRYSITVEDKNKGFDSPIRKMGYFDGKKKNKFIYSETTLAEHLFSGEQKALIQGEPLSFPEEKPTIPEMIVKGDFISPSIQMVSTKFAEVETEEDGEVDPEDNPFAGKKSSKKDKKEDKTKDGKKKKKKDTVAKVVKKDKNPTGTSVADAIGKSKKKKSTGETNEVKVGDIITPGMVVLDDLAIFDDETIDDLIQKGIDSGKIAKVVKVNGVSKKGTSVELRVVTDNGAETFLVFIKPQQSKVDKSKNQKSKQDPVYLSTDPKTDISGMSVAELKTLKESLTEKEDKKIINKLIVSKSAKTFRALRPDDVEALSEEEKAWFRSTFPNIETQYGTLEKGVQAFIKAGKVFVSDGAYSRTLYHEGYHVFFVSKYKTEEERREVLEKVKSELGEKIITTQEGKKIIQTKASEATLGQIDEYLAEEFGWFKKLRGDYNFPTKTIKGIFEAIWEAIKKLFGITSKTTMQRMFEDFDSTREVKMNRKELSDLLPGVTYRVTPELAPLMETVNNIFYATLEDRSESKGDIYMNLGSFINKGTDFWGEFEENLGEYSEGLDIHEQLVANKKELMQAYKEVLARLDIKDYEDLLEKVDQREFGKSNEDYIDRSSVSAYSRASKPLKLYLISKANLFGHRSLASVLHNLLENSQSLQEMLNKLEVAVEDPSYEKFQEAIQIIINDFSVIDTKEMFQLSTHFYSNFSQAKTDKSFILIGDTASIVNSTTKQTAKNIKDTWIKDAKKLIIAEKNDPDFPFGIYVKISGGQVVIDDDKWENFNKEEKKSKRKSLKSKHWKNREGIQNMFRALGLDLSDKEIAENIDAFKGFLDGLAMNREENREEGIPTTLEGLFVDEGSGSKQLAGRVKPIIEILQRTRPTSIELSGYDQAGKRSFPISLPNYIHRVSALAKLQYGPLLTKMRSENSFFKILQRTNMPIEEFTGLDSSNSTNASLDSLKPTDQAYVAIEAILNGRRILPIDGRKTIRTIDVSNTDYDLFDKKIFVKRMKEHLRAEMEDWKAYESSDLVLKNKEANFAEKKDGTVLYTFQEVDAKFRIARNLKKYKQVETAWGEIPEAELDLFFEKHLEYLKEQFEKYLEEVGLLSIQKKKKSGEVKSKILRLNAKSLASSSLGKPVLKNNRKVESEEDTNNYIVDVENTDETYEDFLTYVAGSQFLFDLDASVVFFGGLQSFKNIDEMFKRNARLTSPQVSIDFSEQYLSQKDMYFPRSPMKMGENRGLLNVLTVKDPTAFSTITDKSMEVADGFSWIEYGTLRDILLDSGRWYEQDEQLFQYNMQSLFLLGMEENRNAFFTEENFNIMFSGHNTYSEGVVPRYEGRVLTEDFVEEKIGSAYTGFEKGTINVNHLTATVEIEKPHGIGPAVYPEGEVVENHMMKLSVMALPFMEIRNNPSLLNLAMDMLSSGTDLIQTASSNKGDHAVEYVFDEKGNHELNDDGTKRTEAPELFKDTRIIETLYPEDPSIPVGKAEPLMQNPYIYDKSVLNSEYFDKFRATIPAKFVTLQQDPSEDTGYATLSVQMNSLLRADFIYKLPKEEQEKMLEESRKAEEILKTIRRRAFKLAKVELGVDKENRIPKKNWPKLKRLLVKSASNIHTPDGVRITIERLLDTENTLLKGQEYLNLDFSSLSETLTTMFTSIIEDRVIKIQSEGGQYVQVPNVLFERTLNFYERNSGTGGTSKAEVMIPLPKKLRSWVLKNFGSLDNFNTQLQLSRFGRPSQIDTKTRKILTEIIANRVPTSSLSLIDSFEVVEFLHWSGGKKIVLPDGVTEKSGSDYDVDKLVAYLNSLDILDNKVVSFFPENPSGSVTREDYVTYHKILQDKVIDLSTRILSKTDKVTNGQVEKVLSEPFLKNLLKANIDKKTYKNLLTFSEVLPEERNLDFEFGPELLDILDSIVFLDPEKEDISGITYEDLMSDQYLLNGLKKIYDKFIRHEDNFNNLTEPLSMNSINEAVEEKLKADRTGEKYKNKSALRAFDFVEVLKKQHRFTAGTRDISTTAISLSSHGILSSLNKKVRTALPSIFKDKEFKNSTYTTGEDFIGEGQPTVIKVLDQLEQAQLETVGNPALGYSNILGDVNRIFIAMIRMFPAEGKSVPYSTWLKFITSNEVTSLLAEAQKMSSMVTRMKNNDEYASLPQALDNMARNYSLSEAYDPAPWAKVLDIKAFKKGVKVLDVSYKQLEDEEWRKSNPEKMAAIILFYYNLSQQLTELDNYLYQDSGFASGFSELNGTILSLQNFEESRVMLNPETEEPMQSRSSNLIWSEQDLQEVMEESRTGEVKNVTYEVGEFLTNSKIRGVNPIIHSWLNTVAKNLPRGRKRASAVKKLELLFLTYIVHNYTPKMKGYKQVLTNRLGRKLVELQEESPEHPVWSKLEAVTERLNIKRAERSKVNTILLTSSIEDVNELELMQALLLDEPKILEDLALLSMSKSGFAYESQGMKHILPEDFLFELYLPSYQTFVEEVKNMDEAELKTMLTKMTDIIMTQYKVANDSSMMAYYEKLVQPFNKVESAPSIPLYSLRRSSLYMRGKILDENNEYSEISPEESNIEEVVLRRVTKEEIAGLVKKNKELKYIEADSEGFAFITEGYTTMNLYMPKSIRGDMDLYALQDSPLLFNSVLEAAKDKAKTKETMEKKKGTKRSMEALPEFKSSAPKDLKKTTKKKYKLDLGDVEINFESGYGQVITKVEKSESKEKCKNSKTY